MPPVGGHSVAAGRVASETTRSQIDYARIYARTHPRGPSPFNSRTPLVERPELINALHLPFERVPVSVERDGTCPHCGLDDMTRMYPTWSKIAACLLFPFGLMFMCFNYEDRCPTCNYLSPR
nr:uncharacterized protein LOC123766010 [Procambarus clarkii]